MVSTLDGSACVNGGGQLKPAAEAGVSEKELLAAVDTAYRSTPTRRPEDNAAVQALYRYRCTRRRAGAHD